MKELETVRAYLAENEIEHEETSREGVDGATAYPLMAAAEGWPDSPWMTAWKPAV